MKIIGLTGGIGTGKSTVSAYLSAKGYEIIDADKIAREVVLPGREALREISRTFGKDMILADGSLDRKALARQVFSDKIKKEELDKIMLSRICDEIEARVFALRENPSDMKMAFIDAPLLFEAGLERLTDLVWTVDSDLEVRILRISRRDGISRDEILSRINSQMDREIQLQKSDFVIDNSGNQEELYKKIDEIIKICLKDL